MPGYTCSRERGRRHRCLRVPRLPRAAPRLLRAHERTAARLLAPRVLAPRRSRLAQSPQARDGRRAQPHAPRWPRASRRRWGSKATRRITSCSSCSSGKRPAARRAAAAYAKLSSFTAYRRTRKLDLAHAAYHSTWYIPVVRELAGRSDFRADPAWIAARVQPAIKPAEARAALRTLLDIGLLEAGADGRVTQSTPLVSTGPEMHALLLAEFYRAMMARAAASIDLVTSERRDSRADVARERRGHAPREAEDPALPPRAAAPSARRGWTRRR